MATLFVDFQNGNDAYAGTSFNPLASGTNGRISGTTFSSATASFPNDGSLIGQYLSIFNGSAYVVYTITAWVSSTALTITAISGGTALANQTLDRIFFIGGRWKSLTTGATAVRTMPGDTIRIMGSPEPTSLGQTAVWTSGQLQDAKNLTGATNATPISISCAAHGYSTGDTVVITGVTGNTNANGTWEITSTGANTFTLNGSTGNGTGSGGTARVRNNTRVMLSTPVTQTVACTGPGRTAWTAANANVSTVLTNSGGDSKEHALYDQIAITVNFTTGLAAYWPTGTLDLSGYQQVSFWINQVTGNLGAAGAVSLRLCSDTAGTAVVRTINIPSLGATARWMPITVDLGTSLGSNIQSIALFVNTDSGAQTFRFSNIIACKASSAPDSLTLTSLIGKNSSGETWWGIQSINGTRVMLDNDTNATPSSSGSRGYYGTSETVTTWKRETIKIGPAASSGTSLQALQEAGTEGSPITISGGWDRTSMGTQTLETWLDGVNGLGYAINSNRDFIDATKLAFTRFTRAWDQTAGGSYCHINIVAANNCTTGAADGAVSTSAHRSSFTVGHCVAHQGAAIYLAQGASSNRFTIDHGLVSNNGNAIELATSCLDNSFCKGSGAAVLANNSTDLRNASGACVFNALQFLSPTNCNLNFSTPVVVHAIQCSFEGMTEVLLPGGTPMTTRVYSHHHDQTTNNHKIFLVGALISSASDQRKTASGISWKIQPTHSSIRHSRNPVALSLAKVACAANSLVTVKAWMRRDNSGLTLRLVCKGGQIAGVPQDVIASVTTTNAWEEQAITFTPTEIGVVEITAEAWGGSTLSGWIDAMTISQA